MYEFLDWVSACIEEVTIDTRKTKETDGEVLGQELIEANYAKS